MSGSGEDYMDLNDTLLAVKATNDIPVNAVAPISNTLHSLLSQIDVSLNDVNISSATTTYLYRAYIETHLNYGTDAKKSRLQAAMYFINDNLIVYNPIPDLSSARNMGLKEDMVYVRQNLLSISLVCYT